MIAWFVIGSIGLVLLLLAGRGFVNADPRVLAQGLRIGGAVLCGGLALFFLTRANFYFATLCGAAAAGSLGWWPRGLSLFGFRFGPFGGGNTAGWSRARTAPPNSGPSGSGTAGNQAGGNPAGGPRAAPGARQAGGQSQVETDWLRMTLDRATGDMDGEVLRGRWIGRRLSQLNFRDLVALWRRCDAQSAALLEAWLDRTQAADWREQAAALAAQDDAQAGKPGGGPAPGAGMTREQAWEVLGLPPGSSPEAIRAAHRRLMKLAHPDQGGSTWLAAQVNRAKDMLLGP
jgi:hypothetical protein